MRLLRAVGAIAILLSGCKVHGTNPDGGGPEDDLADSQSEDLAGVEEDLPPGTDLKGRDLARSDAAKDQAPPADPWSPPDLTPCPVGTTTCPSGCSNTDGDPQNCGACGTQCGPGLVCNAGKCGCGAGLTNCSGHCVDLDRDPSNCSACAKPCAGGQACTAGGGACPNNGMLCSGYCRHFQAD